MQADAAETLSTLDFLCQHYRQANQDHFAEFKLIKEGHPEQVFVRLSDLRDRWPALEKAFTTYNRNGVNVYFSLAPRVRESGKTEDVASFNHVFVDIDFKDTPPPMVKKNLEVLGAFNLKPNLAVYTGHGWHLYWLLKEPATIAEIQPVLKTLIRVLGADEVCKDAVRVFRVPGFLNVKERPYIKCELKNPYDYSKEFSLLDFEPLESAADGERLKNAPAPATVASVGGVEKVEVAPAKLTQEVYLNGHGFAYAMANAVAPFWKSGVRHNLAMGVSAWLRQNDVAEKETTAIIEKIVETTGDQKELKDRLDAVRTTYTGPVERVSASTVVIAAIGKDDAVKMLGDCRRALNSVPPPPIKKKKLPPFDFYSYVPSGSWIDRYVVYAAEKLHAPLQFHFACAMGAVAAAIGNKVKIKVETWRPFNAHIFALLMAPPAWYKKTESINIAASVLKKAGVKIFTSNITVEQMYAECCPIPCEWIDKRTNQPCSAPMTPPEMKNVKVAGWRGSPSGAWLFGEFTRTLENANKSYMGDFKPLLLELFDSNDVAEMNSRKTKTSGNYYVEDPAISFVGGITPFATKKNLTVTDALGGLTSRMLPIWYDPEFESDEEWKEPNPEEDVELLKLSDDLKKISEGLAGTIRFTDEARVLWVKLKKDIKSFSKKLEGPDAATIQGSLGRLLTYAGKVGAIVAKSIDPDLLMIDGPTMTFAGEFIRYVMNTLEFIYEEIRPDDGDIINRNIEKLLGAVRRLAASTGDKKFSDREVRLSSHLNGRNFDEAVKAAHDAGMVIHTGKDGDYRRSIILNETD